MKSTTKAGGGYAEGLTVVGERGPELVSLPRGAQVMPLGAFGGAGAKELAREIAAEFAAELANLPPRDQPVVLKD